MRTDSACTGRARVRRTFYAGSGTPCASSETVVFSRILWPYRQVRDDAMNKVMADPRLKPDVNPMPFDGKRLIFGGFNIIVEA